MTPEEYPGPSCWCARKGCLETWVSGPGMAADHARVTGETHTAVEIAARATTGSSAAMATLARHADRLARGLAHVVNIVDPDVLVLGGGLSQLPHLYEVLPRLIVPHIFADRGSVVIKDPKMGRCQRQSRRGPLMGSLITDAHRWPRLPSGRQAFERAPAC
jgi:fructokinase